MTSQFIKFNKIVITKVALIFNVRKVKYNIYCLYMLSRSCVKFKTSVTHCVHSLEKYSIFSTSNSTAINQKTRPVHIHGHLNTYILLFDYGTLLVYTLQLTFKVGVSSIFECMLLANGIQWEGKLLAKVSRPYVAGPNPLK
jgi:hypothetical protein